jgi:hypothetical protein
MTNRERRRYLSKLLDDRDGREKITVMDMRGIVNVLLDYDAAKANEPSTAVHDPRALARMTLDAITGGALSELIAAVRNEVLPRLLCAPAALSAKPSNKMAMEVDDRLRALGEDVP